MALSLTFLRILARRLGMVLLLFTVCRAVFYLYNCNAFAGMTAAGMLYVAAQGLRFDVAAVCMLNLPLIVLSLLPFRHPSSYRYALHGLFLTVNAAALLVNCIDFGYFPFTHKRSTADLFILAATGNDLLNLLPRFLADYWHITLLWLVFTAVLAATGRRLRRVVAAAPTGAKRKSFAVGTMVLAVMVSLAVAGARGGLQLRPIGIATAAQLVTPKYAPLALNTPFTMIKTWQQRRLQEQHYFSPQELAAIYNPVRSRGGMAFRPLNVIVIILESFSSEYIGALNPEMKGFTPFLDSLCGEGLLFTEAFANCKRSIEGIPAILASMPTLMENPYITSPYAGNEIDGIGSLLAAKGYHTSFFHGGANGTMGFDAFAGIAGIGHYYGMNEYGKADYDGHWGIRDEAFFRYFAKTVRTFPQPFFSCVVSLSSHHPYSVPEKYRTILPAGPHPILQSIAYTDLSLRRLFEEFSATPWFDSTLFVITADHTGEALSPASGTGAGAYAIPILWYRRGSELRGQTDRVTQQADIVPGILSLLNYDTLFFAFGSNPFGDGSAGFAISHTGGVFQLIRGAFLLQFAGGRATGLYNRRRDPLLLKNLLKQEKAVAEEMERYVRAVVQTYHSALITNRTSAARW